MWWGPCRDSTERNALQRELVTISRVLAELNKRFVLVRPTAAEVAGGGGAGSGGASGRLRGLLPEGLRPQVGLIEQEDVDEEEADDDEEEPQNEEEALLLVKAAGRTADAARTAKPQEGAGGWQSVRRETRSRTCAIS